jgi:NAD kinase
VTAQSSDQKVILVVRRTRLDELISKYNTVDQARFYIEHLGVDFDDYLQEDKVYKAAVNEVARCLAEVARLHVVDRMYITNFLFGPNDVVIALGQDGLVANVLKYLNGQPLIGVNPDPDRWEGVLLPFSVANIRDITRETIRAQRRYKEVTMALVTLSTGEAMLAVNDLFIGPKSHTSARYMLTFGDRSEGQSSSGVIVSTGLGSTGWLRSIVAGANGISTALASNESHRKVDIEMPWDSDRLVFSVREPWPSKQSGAEITFGTITKSRPLILTSLMPEHGVIFSDGIEADRLQFTSGITAKITVASKKGILVE